MQEPFKKTFLNDNLQNLQTQLVGNDYVTKKWFGTTICKQFFGRKNLHVQKIFRATTTIFWHNFLQNLKQMIPSDNLKVLCQLAAFAEKLFTATTCNCCMEQQFVKPYPEKQFSRFIKNINVELTLFTLCSLCNVYRGHIYQLYKQTSIIYLHLPKLSFQNSNLYRMVLKSKWAYPYYSLFQLMDEEY